MDDRTFAVTFPLRAYVAFILTLVVGASAPHDLRAGEAADSVAPDLAPRWYRLNPVQLHTRLGPLAFDRALLKARPELIVEAARAAIADISPTMTAPTEIAYLRAGERAAALGAGVLVRHVKTGEEPPPWTTDVPAANQAVDLVTPMVQDAHNAGVRMIAYYWHMSDSLAAEADPNWICRTRKGPIIGRRGAMLDLTGPFGDMTATRLEELRSLGVDGIYLDGRHMPSRGCRGAALEAAFEQATGERWSSAKRDTFDAFSADAVQQALAGWSRQFRDDPEFAMIVSMARQPNLLARDATIDLARVGIPKTEFGIPTRSKILDDLIEEFPSWRQTLPRRSTRIAIALSLLRETSNKPPHVWIHRVPGEEDLAHAVGAVLTHGATANVNVLEPELGGAVGDERRQTLEMIFDLNRKLGPILADARPLRFAAVHFSEAARNRRDKATGWLEVVAPIMHTYAALMEANLPVTVLDDHALAKGDLSGIAHLFTPLAQELSGAQLDNLAAQQVTVHELPSVAPQDDDPAERYAKAIEAAAGEISSLPVQIKTDDRRAHATVMRGSVDNEFFVQLVAPFDHIRTGVRRRGASGSQSTASQAGNNLKFAMSSRDQTLTCAWDMIADQALGMNSEGWIELPKGQSYAAIRVTPC